MVERAPFDPADPIDAMAESFRRQVIDMALRALLNPGDEVLLPSPDYPLWSAATILNDGVPVYYDCKPENDFQPDPEQIEALITPRTRALVLINPNNPTGAM